MALLLDLVQETVTPDITRKVSGLVGETPAATDSALRRAAPAVLAGIVDTASTTVGVAQVRALVTEGGWGADVLGTLGGRLTGGSSTGTFLSSGARLVSALLGNKTEGVTDLIASSSGVQRRSASTILCLAAPIVMSVVGMQVASRGLSAAGLATMLAGERSSLIAALPAGIGSLLGMRRPMRPEGEVREARPDINAEAPSIVPERPDPEPAGNLDGSGLARWWPALLVGLAAVATLFFLTPGRRADVGPTRTDVPSASPRQLATVTLPDGARIDVAQGSPVHELSTFLGDRSATELPKRFVFDDLDFERGAARLTPEGRRAAETLAVVLKAYPSVRIVLEGHTDATGDAAANRTLSQHHAEAVKQTLASRGVDAGRMQTGDYGRQHPVAGNDTESGRTRNRRLELVVVSR